MTAEGRRVMAARKRMTKKLSVAAGEPVVYKGGHPVLASNGKRVTGTRGAGVKGQRYLPKPTAK